MLIYCDYFAWITTVEAPEIGGVYAIFIMIWSCCIGFHIDYRQGSKSDKEA